MATEMTNNQALNKLFVLARDKEKAYHPGYEDTVEYTGELKAYFAGVEIEDYMRIFARREDKDLFKQRMDIMAEVQSALGLMLEKPFAKIERSNWKEYVVTGTSEETDSKKALAFKKEVLDKFGTKGLFSYTFERMRYWNIYDPNCFTVVEWKDFDGKKERVRPYPFEVTSEMAVDFKYYQSDLEYLACRQVISKMEDDTEQKVERLTMYRPQWTVVLQQLTEKEYAAVRNKRNNPALNEKFPENIEIPSGWLVNINNAIYEAIIPKAPHGYEKTPAVRMGFIDNPEDNGATKLSIFHAGLPFAKKLLKVNSEVDLTSALVASPIPLRYADKCDARGCDRGVITPTGETCTICNGTGKKQRPTSVQEEITVPLPDSKDDIVVDLAGMFAYIHFPPEAAQFLVTSWDKWFEKANMAIFGSELTTKGEVAQTARFHNRAEAGMNDALWPYGRHITAACGELSRIIAAAAKEPGGFAKPIIPSNLGFETIFDLYDQLKSLRDAGGSAASAAIIEVQIMERLLQDDPEALKRGRVDDRLNPFRGMTEAQIIVALNNPLVSEDKKFFYLNKSEIMELILYSNPAFYSLAPQKQREIIDAKVKELRANIQVTQPQFVPPVNQPNNPANNQNQQ